MTLRDEEIRSLLADRASRADPSGLRESAVAAARATPQLRPLVRAPLVGPMLRLTAALVGLAAVLLVVALVALALRPSPRGPLGGIATSPASAGSPAPASPPPPSLLPSPTPSDVALTPPPYVQGTCPVTPFTDLVEGTDPEMVVSGVRWRWGGIPWQARIGKKVIVLPATEEAYVDTNEILAERLPLGSPSSSVSVVYPNSGNSQVYGIGLPEPGCWLLTLIGPIGRSSVVVEAAAAPPNPPGPLSQNVPTTSAPLRPPSRCPITAPEPSASVRTWFDGNYAWQDPDPSPWLPAKERKLVVGGTGDNRPFERLVATRIGAVGRSGNASPPAFVAPAAAIATPVPGGGNKAAGLTLPTTGCWAITYLDPTTTSTIVVQLGP